MKIKPITLGRIAAIATFVLGVLLTALLLNTSKKGFFARLWPPDVAWVGWCVLGAVVGALIRKWAEKRERY